MGVAVPSVGGSKVRIAAAKAQSSASAANNAANAAATSALGGTAGIVRCRRCAREAVFEDSRAEVWEDGDGRRYVGGDNVTVVAVPGVLRYLDVELAAMGIRMKVKIGN